MWARNVWPLCRSMPLPVRSFDPSSGVTPPTVGATPFRNSPVELMPSPSLLYRSNLTARLLAMPPVPPVVSGPKPRPPPEGPRAVAALFWIVNVMPSAEGLVSRKSKRVEKRAVLIRPVENALPAWLFRPLVSRRAVPETAAVPFRVRPADAANPVEKSNPSGMTSTKLILLFDAPEPLLIVSRPSATLTLTQPSNQRVDVVGVPLTARTASTLVRKTLSVWLGSPETTWTRYDPLGTASSHTALGFSGFCMCCKVS